MYHHESADTLVAPTDDLDRAGRVYIVVLNWNGWRDTILCLESILGLRYHDFCTVVCDNGSTDRSVDHILEWARARTGGSLSALSCVEGGKTSTSERYATPSPGRDLIVLRNASNLGFAGGNNAGLRLALGRSDMEYAWVLNNDTLVDPESLGHLVHKIKSSIRFGICGSTLLYPTGVNTEGQYTVQAKGGVYNKWFGRTDHFASFTNAEDFDDEDECARKMDYVVGASMLVSKSFLKVVGLMCEEYFLYFEELDWTLRAGRRFDFAYAARSLVFHRGGAATGATKLQKSPTGEYYGTRARVMFTKKFYPYALPTVLLAIGASALRQLFKGRGNMTQLILIAMCDGLRGSTGASSHV